MSKSGSSTFLTAPEALGHLFDAGRYADVQRQMEGKEIAHRLLGDAFQEGGIVGGIPGHGNTWRGSSYPSVSKPQSSLIDGL